MTTVIRKSNNIILILLLFILFSAFIIAGGFWWYGNQKKAALKNCKETLESIADLKRNEIVQWRQERIGDAQSISRSSFFLEKVEALLKNKNDSQEREKAIRSRLNILLKPFGYSNIFLLDSKGENVLSVNETYKGTLRAYP